MFKRLFWLTVGASFGVGTTVWVGRTVKQTMNRLTPQRISSDLVVTARSKAADLKAAVAEGREAMHQQEAALRAQIETRQAAAAQRRRATTVN
jgi:hypothetical protein